MSAVAAEFRPTGVVVGDDGSRHAEAAVRFAAEEARRRGVALHIVRAFSVLTAHRPDDLPFGFVAAEAELETSTLAEVRRRWAGLDAPEVRLHAVHAPAAKLLMAAGETADVLVVGARGVGGFDALVLGSVADQVVHHARCPVIVVKARA